MTTPDTVTPRATASRRAAAKPFTLAESRARQLGNAYLELAMSYRSANDVPNAVSCCVEGLSVTHGISRPLMVRDQLTDVLSCLDPTASIRSQIRPVAHTSTAHTQPCSVPRPTAPQSRPTYLERLVSCHQLLDYPSLYSRFNQAYDEAASCVTSQSVRELYIVQYRPVCGSSHADNLYFSFVPAALICAEGPYYLTDICAVVRK